MKSIANCPDCAGLADSYRMGGRKHMVLCKRHRPAGELPGTIKVTETPAEKTFCDLVNDAQEAVSMIEDFLIEHGCKTKFLTIGEIAGGLNDLFDEAIGFVRSVKHDAEACEWCKFRTGNGA